MDALLFQRLVDTWYDPLYRFALSLSRNGDEAMDLTQQTFARWAEKGHGIRDRSKAKAWLFTVLYREFLKNVRHHRRESTGTEEGFFDSIPADGPTAAKAAEGQEVLKALHKIDPLFRAPLTLFYLECHSYREIAEILDVPLGTVMSRISRAKKQLREYLTRQSKPQLGQVIPIKQSNGH